MKNDTAIAPQSLPDYLDDGVITCGVDLSHHNGEIDFHALWRAGVRFVICKASEGVNFVDEMYPIYRAQARAVGMLFGAYHFLLPGLRGATQAQHFLRAAAPVPGDLIPTLDVETEGQYIAEAAAAAAASVKAATGRFPMLYSSQDFYRMHLAGVHAATDAPLWIARYGNPPVVPCQIWQYTDSVSYPPNPRLDGNMYHGDPHDMAQRIMLR